MTSPYYVDDLKVPVEVTRDADGEDPRPDAEVASARELWMGCSYCLNPRHPGPCAKPGSKAYERRHGKGKDAPSGGGGSVGEGSGAPGAGPSDTSSDVVSGREALKQTPAVAPHAFTRDEMPPDTIELSPGEKKALDVYSNDAQRINDQLRSGEPSVRTERTARQIDHVMDRSPLRSDIEVHRGVTDGEKVFGSRLSGNLAGAEWSETAFVSTTANRRVATEFAGMHGNANPPVVMRITARKGTGAVTMSSWGNGTALGGQAEVLLPRGLKLRVTADHGVNPVEGIDGGARMLDVEVLV